jgi:hypothetical protein
VIATGIHDGYHLMFAWFLRSRRTFVADLYPIVSKKEQS